MAWTIKNRRLAAVSYMWAFAALRSSEPRAHYDRRRGGGERHTPALRKPTLYDAEKAFPERLTLAA
ncbi:hypothetical protein [Streptomyces canus]|uniref:hypothetical protein n=1 Tax=Streptomyces canus TaxID=58343 RepID=UPI002DDB6F53|nr:hypothetical protein [Streptomyces canus]WSD83090.1 hypothetical protein OG925_01450 [Streptomyces canus]